VCSSDLGLQGVEESIRTLKVLRQGRLEGMASSEELHLRPVASPAPVKVPSAPPSVRAPW
jgi:hypothetical protein